MKKNILRRINIYSILPSAIWLAGLLLSANAFFLGFSGFEKQFEEELFNRELRAWMNQIYQKQDTGEMLFQIPISISWKGEIFGVFRSGKAYAIKRISDKYPEFYAFFPDEYQNDILTGNVYITGKWLGTSCGYKRTVFSNSCVPYVQIQHVE